MRHLRIFGFFCVVAIPTLAACSATPAEDNVDEVSSDLVQFPAAAFAAAPLLTYGATSASIPYTRGTWGVIRWNGNAGDEFVATVAATTADRTARAYLVEKRADGKYVAILSGTNSVDGIVRAKLEKTQQYFIVFREYSQRNAAFTVNLEKANALPAACSGTPLLEAGIIARTPQAETPALIVTGTYETNVRRCNVATGCADPVNWKDPNAGVAMTKRADGKWFIQSPFAADHDGTTGELKGSASVRADDGRYIAVPLAGAATTGCLSLSGRGRNEIDPITYYDVEVTFRATTPPVAVRTPYPATPPPTECDGEPLIPDEELLARFPRGASTVLLGSATILEDSQYCHPQTGCKPWARYATNITIKATGVVLGRDSLGMRFYNNQSGGGNVDFPIDDGTIAVGADQLARGAVSNTGTISDTHISLKETTVAVSGDNKYRRYVCIAIPPHP